MMLDALLDFLASQQGFRPHSSATNPTLCHKEDEHCSDGAVQNTPQAVQHFQQSEHFHEVHHEALQDLPQ